MLFRESNPRETPLPQDIPSSDTSGQEEDEPIHEDKPTPKKGFAAMDPDKRRDASSKGGKTSRGGGRPSEPKTTVVSVVTPDSEPAPKRKRGFAAMSPEKRKAIASSGGKASHGGGRPSTQAKNTPGKPGSTGKRGFAAMDPEKRKAVASLGGKTSQRKKKN